MAEFSSLLASEESAFTPVPSVPQEVLDVLEELCCKFMMNIVQENRGDVKCLFFQAEQAYWQYIDYYYEHSPHIYPNYTFKEFCDLLFSHYPEILEGHPIDLNNEFIEWKRFKSSVPTYGAIIVDDTLKYCLLVQAHMTRVSWGFPKGKIQAGESPAHCAYREVLEETGLDISEYINEEEYIEKEINERLARLYLVSGVSKDTKFLAHTKNEIKDYGWFKIEDIPTSSKDTESGIKLNIKPNAFAMTMPFLKNLKKWIRSTHKKATNQGKGNINQTSSTSSASTDMWQSSYPGNTEDVCDELRAIFGLDNGAKDTSSSPHSKIKGKSILDEIRTIDIHPSATKPNTSQPIGTEKDRGRMFDEKIERLTDAFVKRYENLLLQELTRRNEIEEKQMMLLKSITEFDLHKHLNVSTLKFNVDL